MSTQTAQTVVLIISIAAAVVWLTAVCLWWFTRRPKKTEPVSRRLPDKQVTEVRDSLSRAAALMVPPCELIGGDSDGAMFRLMLPGKPEMLVEVGLDDRGVTVATAELTSQEAPLWYRLLMPIWLGLTFVIGVVGVWLMLTFVVPHQDPNVRGQAMQMLQITHFIWPPFMFLAIRKVLQWITLKQRDRFLTTLELL